MTGQLPLVLKVDDVAKELGVSRSAVYRRIASDDLPVFQWGGARHAIRISRVQFEQWVAGRRRASFRVVR